VSETRGQTYAELYRKLDTKYGENDIYKMVNFEKGRQKDFNQDKYIKDDADRLLMNNDNIKNGWREYFDKLFNEESEQTAIELDNSFDDTNK
jgi:hypothetical protein